MIRIIIVFESMKLDFPSIADTKNEIQAVKFTIFL